jgi:hypothetical protein
MQTPEFVFRSMEDAPIQPNDRVAFGALEWGDGGAPGNRAPPNLDIYQSASSGADRYESVDTVSIATDVMDPVGRLFDGDLSHHGGQVDISTNPMLIDMQYDATQLREFMYCPFVAHSDTQCTTAVLLSDSSSPNQNSNERDVTIPGSCATDGTQARYTLSNGDTAWTSSVFSASTCADTRDLAQAFDGNTDGVFWDQAFHGAYLQSTWRTTSIRVRYSWQTSTLLMTEGVPASGSTLTGGDEKVVTSVSVFQSPNGHKTGRVEIHYLGADGQIYSVSNPSAGEFGDGQLNEGYELQISFDAVQTTMIEIEMWSRNNENNEYYVGLAEIRIHGCNSNSNNNRRDVPVNPSEVVILSSADNINWSEEARWTGDPGAGGNDAIPLIGENPESATSQSLSDFVHGDKWGLAFVYDSNDHSAANDPLLTTCDSWGYAGATQITDEWDTENGHDSTRGLSRQALFTQPDRTSITQNIEWYFCDAKAVTSINVFPILTWHGMQRGTLQYMRDGEWMTVVDAAIVSTSTGNGLSMTSDGTISAERWRIADWRCEGNQRIDGIDLQIIEAANQFDCVAFEFDGMAWASQGVVKYLGAN